MIVTLSIALILAQAGAPPGAPAHQASEPTTVAPAEVVAPEIQAAAPRKDPIVCKSETPIGSRLPQKTCMLKSERDRLRADARKRLEDIQTSSHGPFKSPDS